eukprot:CAMPEP_0195014892 /NCGR_PEP_ID=MMETSP0326_2-20130528/16756_1 /TAXON_ID=2866 ORGANISM="Crypthecodinium cohnii, Strain Seligo" /NCGR_SAMPLE_ID=MMETSP0326_2 /ASSEMBLY_ACC=CAM_ASM_000348 /LENGTH=81 /DNA_ID=CAMNT_0040028473 /DNA_START=65 /DNA_END=308 /DNA_ORIENTATION=-
MRSRLKQGLVVRRQDEEGEKQAGKFGGISHIEEKRKQVTGNRFGLGPDKGKPHMAPELHGDRVEWGPGEWSAMLWRQLRQR